MLLQSLRAREVLWPSVSLKSWCLGAGPRSQPYGKGSAASTTDFGPASVEGQCVCQRNRTSAQANPQPPMNDMLPERNSLNRLQGTSDFEKRAAQSEASPDGLRNAKKGVPWWLSPRHIRVWGACEREPIRLNYGCAFSYLQSFLLGYSCSAENAQTTLHVQVSTRRCGCRTCPRMRKESVSVRGKSCMPGYPLAQRGPYCFFM